MSNTRTARTARTAAVNAGAAAMQEAPFNKIVNGEPAFFEAEAAEAIISPDASDESKRRERQFRRMAAKKGLVVKKSRRKHATDTDKGLYGLFNLSGNAIAGATYNLSLDELSKIISVGDTVADADNTAEKAAEATQTEKEATPHTGTGETPEQQSEENEGSEIFFHVYRAFVNSKYFTEKDHLNMLEFYLEGKKNTLRNLREFIQNKDSFSEDDRCRYLQFINDSERKYLEETERNKILNDYINSRKMTHYCEFFNIDNPIYSGVELKQITEDVINATFKYIVNDLLNLLINDAGFKDSAGSICCIFADYIKKSKTGQVA